MPSNATFFRIFGQDATHYSAAELRELVEAIEYIATDNLRESQAQTLYMARMTALRASCLTDCIPAIKNTAY